MTTFLVYAPAAAGHVFHSYRGCSRFRLGARPCIFERVPSCWPPPERPGSMDLPATLASRTSSCATTSRVATSTVSVRR